MVRWSADDIIYEDAQILVCRKHSGMAVQSARVGQMDLESELRNYRNGNYIGIVQRLDQPDTHQTSYCHRIPSGHTPGLPSPVFLLPGASKKTSSPADPFPVPVPDPEEVGMDTPCKRESAAHTACYPPLSFFSIYATPYFYVIVT